MVFKEEKNLSSLQYQTDSLNRLMVEHKMKRKMKSMFGGQKIIEETQIEIIESDFLVGGKLKIASDVYNLTIAANLT